MPSFQKRLVDKFLADKLESELEALRDPDQQGIGTIFASLTHWVHLAKSDMKLVERQIEREIIRLRRSASLPDHWRDVRDALVGEEGDEDKGRKKNPQNR